jgi:MFS family permease
MRWREQLRVRRNSVEKEEEKQSLWAILPRPLYIIGTLLFLDFIGSFGFAFVEPQMIFYFYDTLLWTTVQFGVVVGAYGVVMVFGQMVLGHLSDRWGRKPVILLGLVPNLFFYIGLAVLTDYNLMILVAAFAGLGNALIAPAVSAFYLDITARQHRARIIGIKESFLALGGVLGPLAVAAIAPLTTPQGVFWIASILALLGLLLAFFLREPQRIPVHSLGVQEEISIQRSLAAQASLRGIVMRAYDARNPPRSKKTRIGEGEFNSS